MAMVKWRWMERSIACPSCGENIRLTREELAQKRGFCALCGARFDLLPEMLIGDGPHRSIPVVPAADLPKPPSSRIDDATKDDVPAIVLRQAGPRWIAALPLAFTAVWLGVVGLGFSTSVLGRGFATRGLPVHHVTSPPFLPLFFLPFFLIGGLIFCTALFAIVGREEVRFDGEQLVRRRGIGRLVREKRIALGPIQSFQVAQTTGNRFGQFRMNFGQAPMWWTVKALTPGQDSLALGEGLGYDEEAMQWLARRLERSLRIWRSRHS